MSKKIDLSADIASNARKTPDAHKEVTEIN
jgi:hypothetical protein